MIADFIKLKAGTKVRGCPLMIKTARKTYRDADGTVYQEVVFMDSSGEIRGDIVLGEGDIGGHKDTGQLHKWQSKTNLVVMNAELQWTDSRGKEGNKLVVFDCFDAATPLSYDQKEELETAEWKTAREEEIRGKIRHWLACSILQSHVGPKYLEPVPELKNVINDWTDFIVTGE